VTSADRMTGAASFQSAAGAQGRQFAAQCDMVLELSGFHLQGRLLATEIGVEIDQAAVAPSGATVWFEYKGSFQGSRPGLLRTDTLKKAIANGALVGTLPSHPPFVVLTSHVPEAGAGLSMMKAALDAGILADVVCVNTPAHVARLSEL
jgi:hypothetical protein